jgi:hypothetical protein
LVTCVVFGYNLRDITTGRDRDTISDAAAEAEHIAAIWMNVLTDYENEDYDSGGEQQIRCESSSKSTCSSTATCCAKTYIKPLRCATSTRLCLLMWLNWYGSTGSSKKPTTHATSTIKRVGTLWYVPPENVSSLY